MRLRSFLLLLGGLLAGGDVLASQATVQGPKASAASAIRMAIEIPRLMQLRILEQPRRLEITGEDLARGFVLARGRVEVLSTLRRGYLLRAQLAPGPVLEADLDGFERPLRASSDAPPVEMPSMVGRPRPGPHDVEYRLRLAPGTVAGSYAWPVALSLEEP